MAWVRRGARCRKFRKAPIATFEVGGRQVLIARAPMGLFAVGAICSHQQHRSKAAR